MAIAAVPDYIGTDFTQASPGMRFGMFLNIWGVNRRTCDVLWTLHDIDYEVRGQDRREREVKFDNKVPALKAATRLNDVDKKAMGALLARQKQGFAVSMTAGQGLLVEGTAIAPFTTGLGNEHPLENGFAFLNPYGLPYLPGSGVKGVLRQAARELASGEWGDDHGWSDDKVYPLIVDDKPVLDKDRHPVLLSKLDILFGRETDDGDSNHLRGALTFWDVIPQIKGDHLTVEIMTPHQGHYYQDGQTPHDSGQPIPISFLTVPPGSGFTFHVQCDTPLLAQHAPELAANAGWQTLLQAAFEHAFSWLGFGAKTAVGYGAMVSEYARRKQAEREAERREAERQAEAARLREQALANAETWTDARIKYNRANGALSVEKSGKTAVALNGQEILASLPADLRKKVEANQFVKVTARVAGKELLNILA